MSSRTRSTAGTAPGTEPGALSVAVVGAGVGGLALAVALARVGIACRVFEQATRLTEVGAGLQLAPNAVRLLHRLGLAQPLARSAVRPLSLDVLRWDDGRQLSRTALGEECTALYGAPYRTVRRADLHGALLARAGDVVRLGHRLVALEEQPDGVVLRFADGSAHRADAVVGADGIRSRVRAALTDDDPVFSGQFVYRGLVPAERVPRLADQPRIRVWVGPGRHCVCYPVDAGRTLNFVATAPGSAPPEESWTTRADPSEVTGAYRGWHGPLRDLLAAADTVSRWALYDRAELATWSTDRVTVLGDAAHPMLPFAAQGANQAVEDAMTLAVCLAGTGRAGVGEALRRYEELRVPRTADLQRGARDRAEVMHLADGPRQRERDAGWREAGDLRRMGWLYGYDALATAVGSRRDQRPSSARSPVLPAQER